ncbi:response regulator [Pleomorphovibrio marinus]|uniref:response regulator n=1 Tax=Pleomorphovibrio marinus TaxID=2164132 RepID=UPI001E3BC2D7|nr:response regulator [Pleomorphovibrio marinus]
MRPELKSALGFGMLSAVVFLFPAVFHAPIVSFLGLSSITPLLVTMSVAVVVMVMFYAYRCFKRYKDTEEDLEARYRLIFEKLPNAVWVLSLNDFSILTANELAIKKYGEVSENGSQKVFSSLFQYPEKVKLENMQEPHTIRNLIMIDKKYDARHVDLFSMPFIYDGEDSVMVLAVDHSEIHGSLKENMKLNESLKAQNQQLKDFSFVHSHHIRNHLANIMGILNLAGDQEQLNKEVLDMLKKSAHNLDTEIRKVNKILMEKNIENGESVKDGDPSKVIVFVDDDKVQHMINKRILLKINPKLNLVFFENPHEALSWLAENPADILLLDINMPEMEGWEFLSLMGQIGINIEVKMLTSSLDPEDIEKSKKFELVSGFLVKPLRKEVIDEFIND